MSRAGIKDAYSVDYFRNPDKTMRNATEFIAFWEKEGIDTNKKHLSFMCGSGWSNDSANRMIGQHYHHSL